MERSREMSKRQTKSEATLRRKAYQLGYALVQPCGDAAKDIKKHSAGPYILVPHNVGLAIEEVETMLERIAAAQVSGLTSGMVH
jgi:hypothetical protein